MYFTIPTAPPSTPPLSDDALASYSRLRRQAASLAELSASFAAEAQAVADAYARALIDGNGESWASFVAAAASLVRHGDSVESIVHLAPGERAAYDFFAQIARENADLLEAAAFSVA